jgi:hypothetical protein
LSMMVYGRDGDRDGNNARALVTDMIVNAIKLLDIVVCRMYNRACGRSPLWARRQQGRPTAEHKLVRKRTTCATTCQYTS